MQPSGKVQLIVGLATAVGGVAIPIMLPGAPQWIGYALFLVALGLIGWAAVTHGSEMRSRQVSPLEMYFVIRDLKTELLKADLVKKWTLPLGSQELRLYVLSRGQRHLEEISVRFQKYASRSDMPDNVHPDIIRVTGVSDYYIETAEWQGSVAKSEADPRGGWRLVYDRPITWPKGKPLPLRVQVLAQQRWSGYISLQDRRTYDTVRLPVKIE